MQSSQFLRLVKDCDLLAPGLTSSASVQVVYTSEVKRSKSGGDRMSYNSFLNALMRLAVQVSAKRAVVVVCSAAHCRVTAQAFRDSRSEADAFERLLKDHVLPLACRRCVERRDTSRRSPPPDAARATAQQPRARGRVLGRPGRPRAV